MGPTLAPVRPSDDPDGRALVDEAPLTAAAAAEMRAAELGLAGAAERTLTLDFGARLDRFIAGELVQQREGHALGDGRQVIEALLRIAAGIAIVRNRDAIWFQDYARGIYAEERTAREGRVP